MKLEKAALITKGLCYLMVGFSASFVSGITQYGADEEITSKAWIVIVILALGGAATQMLAFLSSSFSEYKQKTTIETKP